MRNTYRNDEMADVRCARGCFHHVGFTSHSATTRFLLTSTSLTEYNQTSVILN